MEERREVRIPLETVLKRSWPLLAFGAVLVFGVIIGLVWFAVSGAGRRSATGSVQATSTTESASSTADFIPRVLDGVRVTPAESQLQPYAVMVENHVDARPLSGPALANLVYEIPVEGGITRYMLVFDATTTVETIGPVRSARPYFVDYADGLNAVYTHVGGSPEALTKISALPSFRDVNEFWNGKYFWRSGKRMAPHNTYTRTDLLHEAYTSKEWDVGSFGAWHYKEDDVMEHATATVRGTTDGPLLRYGGSYTASWTYDRTTNMYMRFEAGRAQKDQDGSNVFAKNIVVLHTDGSVIDAEGRLRIRTTGRGKATLYRDGQALEVVWLRTSGTHLRFETTDGNDAVFNRGTTWIEVVTDSATTATSTSR